MALTLTLLFIASALTVTGEVLLKLGIDHLGGFSPTPMGLFRTFTDWRVFLGFTLVFGGALFWLGVISRVDLSFAYPLLAFNYVIIMIPSHFVLRETITPTKVVGALIVVVGVIVLTWGQGKS